MIDVTMVHRRSMKTVLTRQPNRFLSRIGIAASLQTVFPIVIDLRLERIALLVLGQYFSSHLAIKRATSYLTRL